MSENKTIYRYFCISENNYVIEKRLTPPTRCINEDSNIEDIIILGNIIGDNGNIKNLNSLLIGQNNYQISDNNFYIFSINPTVTDDITKGFVIGTRWINTNSLQEYVCLNNSEGAAVWKITSATNTDDINESDDNRFYKEKWFNKSLSNRTTDDLNEGDKNLYCTTERINNSVHNVIATITSDDVQEGSTNLYFTQQQLTNSLKIRTSDILTEGALNKYFTKSRFNECFTQKTSDALKEGRFNLYFTQQNFDNSLSKRTTDDLIEGINCLFYTEERFNTSFTNKNTDNLNEGSTNLYYTDSKVAASPHVTLNTTHRTDIENPHNVTKTQIGLRYVDNIKNNLNAVNDPKNDDDLTKDYMIGSSWINLISEQHFICIDATQQNAVWKNTTTRPLRNTGSVGINILKTDNNWYSLKRLHSLNDKIVIHDDIFNNKIGFDIDEGQLDVNNFQNVLNVSKGGTGKISFPLDKFLHGYGTEIKATKSIPSGDVVGTTDSQVLQNKTINCLSNTIYNLSNTSIKADAGINASKIANGIVTNTEFQYLRGLTGNIQQQINDIEIIQLEGVTKETIGLGDVENIKSKYNATENPSTFDDSMMGYTIGSEWFNVNQNRHFICLNNTANHAIWKETTESGGEINTGANTGSGEGIYYSKTGSVLNFKSLKNGSNVNLTTSSNELTINSTVTHSFNLFIAPIEVANNDFETVCYFPWKKPEMDNFKDGKMVFEVVLDDKSFEFRVYDMTNNAVLGTSGELISSGFYSFSVSNPPTDARLEIQTKTESSGSVYPMVYGMVLKYDA